MVLWMRAPPFTLTPETLSEFPSNELTKSSVNLARSLPSKRRCSYYKYCKDVLVNPVNISSPTLTYWNLAVTNVNK